MTELTLKLIIFGDAGTGKTTLAHRYMTGLFKQNKLTLGVQFHVKRVNLTMDDGATHSVKLQIWDFAGEKRFRFLLPSYCRGAHGGLFLYDITDSQSLQHMAEWIGLVQENAGHVPVMLVAAKADLEEHRVISREDGMNWAQQHEMIGFVETSSKTGVNIETTFETITKLMLKGTLE